MISPIEAHQSSLARHFLEVAKQFNEEIMRLSDAGLSVEMVVQTSFQGEKPGAAFTEQIEVRVFPATWIFVP